MTNVDIDPVALAHRMFDALGRGDRETLLECVSPDAVVWHNYDDREKPFSSRIDGLIRASSVTRRFQYVDRRYTALADGAVLQHHLVGEVPGGDLFDAPISVRAHVKDGRFVRFEEYFDQATLAPLYAVMRPKIAEGAGV
jgi:ketosteroid isomerase-like protein